MACSRISRSGTGGGGGASTAAFLDGRQARGAVVEVAGQHHADHALSPCQRGRSEQRIDRGPRVVLAGAARQPDLVGGEQHVVIGRRDVDRAGHERLAVVGMNRRQHAACAEQLRQDAALAAHVQNHADHSVQPRGQRRRDFEQRGDASRGSTDHDRMGRIHQIILRGFGDFEMPGRPRSPRPTTRRWRLRRRVGNRGGRLDAISTFEDMHMAAYSSILGADIAPTQSKGRDSEALGPSDSSDSGSDAVGTAEIHGDSDAAGTGERGSVTPGEGREGGDILPDRVVNLRDGEGMPEADPDSTEMTDLDEDQAMGE